MVFGSDYCHGVGDGIQNDTTVSLVVHKGNGKFILDMIRSGNLILTPSLHTYVLISSLSLTLLRAYFRVSIPSKWSFGVFWRLLHGDFCQSFPDCAIACCCC